MKSSRTPNFSDHIQRLVNIGIVLVAAYLSLYLRFGSSLAPNSYYEKCAYGASLIFLFLSNTNPYPSNRSHPVSGLINLSKLWVLSFLSIVLILIFTQSGNFISRIWLLLWLISSLLLLITSELLFEFIFYPAFKKNAYSKRIALIGSGTVANQLVRQLRLYPNSGYTLTTHILSPTPDLIMPLANSLLDEIWIALPIAEANQLPTIVAQLEHSAANIRYAPDLFTFRLINHGSSMTFGVPMLNLNSSPFTGGNLLLKGIEDFTLSLLILFFIAPVLVLLAISVKFSSPGPIFYRQERVGLNGKPFMMLKFRSMPVDIEKNGAHWGGSDNKVAHPLAKWMRRLNLDELPQFINVLKGEMSIVGPRPERTEFIGQFRDQIPNYMKKHLVKAGITGWAQVHGLRGDTDLHKRIEYDLFYIENWSIWLDLKIILMTIIQTIQAKKPSLSLDQTP